MSVRRDRPLRRFAVVCALGLLAAGRAAAQADGCEALSRPMMNLRAFERAAEGYVRLLPRSEAASALLLCLKRDHPALAETLMLFRRRLQGPAHADAAVERAFLHYVVNTGHPRLEERETADLERLLRDYRRSLLLPAAPTADDAAACDPPPWTLATLRCLGQLANRQRYGRDDVVPVELIDFDAAAAGYSSPGAAWMSELAALAYWNPDLIEEQLRRWGYVRLAQLADPATDGSGFLAAGGQGLVLSFRGTSGFKNFLSDGNIQRVPADWAAGTMHRGFKTALDALWPQIVAQLGPPASQQRAIWVTGHSLGAALAQLAALRLSVAGYRVQGVYTFGTPRIGDQAFVADYDRRLGAQSFPHVNASDLVARVPPQALGFRATASAKIRQFTGDKHDLREQPGEPADALGLAGDWRAQVMQSIAKTTAFLPDALRPAALLASVPAAPPTANLYSASFQKGPLDDHGSFEYLFKLLCATIDHDLWSVEVRQSRPRDEAERARR